MLSNSKYPVISIALVLCWMFVVAEAPHRQRPPRPVRPRRAFLVLSGREIPFPDEDLLPAAIGFG
jgi:hypothetical protein